MTAHTRQQSLDILRTLRAAGHTSYWAGGCVRDLLLDRTPKDYDIATAARPEEILGLFDKTLAVGQAFGVITVVIGKHPHEVATFRRDLDYHDGRHPEGVTFSEPEEDARRRDFTVNGLFYDPETEQILDFVNGQEDVQHKVIRAIGNPHDRFEEDALRMLRAVRLAATLEFSIEEQTAAAIRELAGTIARVSTERIQQELTRMLTEAPLAGQGLALLLDLGLLEVILPEVARMHGQAQPPEFHPEGDVFTHTVLMLDGMENPDPILAYAVLLHDVGKPPTAAVSIEPDGRERIRFNGHAHQGATMATEILRRLKLPNAVIEGATHCIANHMRFMDVPNMKRSTLRRMVGDPLFPSELKLHRLDCLCSHGDLSNYTFLRQFQKDLANEPVLPDPWISGHDIMALGILEGPAIGHWHKTAYERQLEGSSASKEELLTWLRSEIENGQG